MSPPSRACTGHPTAIRGIGVGSGGIDSPPHPPDTNVYYGGCCRRYIRTHTSHAGTSHAYASPTFARPIRGPHRRRIDAPVARRVRRGVRLRQLRHRPHALHRGPSPTVRGGRGAPRDRRLPPRVRCAVGGARVRRRDRRAAGGPGPRRRRHAEPRRRDAQRPPRERNRARRRRALAGLRRGLSRLAGQPHPLRPGRVRSDLDRRGVLPLDGRVPRPRGSPRDDPARALPDRRDAVRAGVPHRRARGARSPRSRRCRWFGRQRRRRPTGPEDPTGRAGRRSAGADRGATPGGRAAARRHEQRRGTDRRPRPRRARGLRGGGRRGRRRARPAGPLLPAGSRTPRRLRPERARPGVRPVGRRRVRCPLGALPGRDPRGSRRRPDRHRSREGDLPALALRDRRDGAGRPDRRAPTASAGRSRAGSARSSPTPKRGSSPSSATAATCSATPP